MITLAPFSEKSRTPAAPIPLAPPVMIATFPSSLKVDEGRSNIDRVDPINSFMIV